MTDEGKRSAQQQFGRRASWYTVSEFHQESEGLATLLRLAAPTAPDCALDVATGTGFTAFALAPHCRRVVALDFTPAMVGQAHQLRRQRGLSNVDFCLGNAERLPFRDAAFDIATCRVAAHHFHDLPRALGEMARVTRPGGRVVLDDTCTPEASDLAEVMNEWELRRDPSHVANLSPSRLRALLEDAGLRVEAAHHMRSPHDFDDWVRRAGVPPEEVEALWLSFAGASAAAREAFHIHVEGSALHFAWPEIVMLGVKR